MKHLMAFFLLIGTLSAQTNITVSIGVIQHDQAREQGVIRYDFMYYAGQDSANAIPNTRINGIFVTAQSADTVWVHDLYLTQPEEGFYIRCCVWASDAAGNKSGSRYSDVYFFNLDENFISMPAGILVKVKRR